MKNQSQRTVLHLADVPSDETIALLNCLASRRWNIHLVYRRLPADIELDSNIALHRLPISLTYPLTYLAFIAAAPVIWSIKPDLIHAHYLTRSGILAAVYRRFLRFKPMVLTACGRDVVVEARSGMTRWSAEHALRMFEIITGDCDEIIAGLHRLEAPVDRIERIDWSSGTENAVDAAAEQLETIYTDLIRRHSK